MELLVNSRAGEGGKGYYQQGLGLSIWSYHCAICELAPFHLLHFEASAALILPES